MPDRKMLRLAVFDVEGVLVPKNRYLLLEVGMGLDLSQFARMVAAGVLYELGLISLKSAMKRIFRFFKGHRVEKLLQIFRQIPLTPDVEELFRRLKSEGVKTALISSGLPVFVVQDLAATLGADYAFGLDLEAEEAVASGEVGGEVVEHNGKLRILKRVLEAEGLAPEDCVVIADDRNNAPMFLPKALKIGYNPDFVIRVMADHVVAGHPLEILSVIKGEARKRGVLPSRNEIFRETIHAFGFSVPILLGMAGRYIITVLILLVTFMYTISELMMMEGKKLPIVSSIARHAATPEELHEFGTAPVFFAFGILFTLLLFPAPASSAAIAIFALGDSTAAIFGKMLGRTAIPLNKGKTLEGAFIGFLCSFVAATFFVDPTTAAIGAGLAMVMESLPLPLNDNLVVPIVTGFALAFVG